MNLAPALVNELLTVKNGLLHYWPDFTFSHMNVLSHRKDLTSQVNY